MSAFAIAVAFTSVATARQPGTDGQCKVTKTARVGGEGGGRIFVMSVEREPAPAPAPGAAPGGRGPQARAIPGSFSILVISK